MDSIVGDEIEGAVSFFLNFVLRNGESVRQNPPAVYEFEDFRLDTVRRVLYRGAEVVQVPSKVFDLLLALVQNSNRELTTDELRRLLWPDRHVEDSNLTQSVFLLRKALGQNSAQNRLIVTIPGRGYRFCGELKQSASGVSSSAVTPPADRVQAQDTRKTSYSLGVMPFRLPNNRPGGQYLSVGITDALVARFTLVRGITARPASFAVGHAGLSEKPLAVGREMGVDFLLTGTLQQKRSKIRIAATLTDIRSGSVVWSDYLEGNLLNIFSLQESIFEQVMKVLGSDFTIDEGQRLTKRYTDNHEAYQAYLKGRYYSGKWTKVGWMKSVQCFGRAIQLDPEYAPAYAGLADCYYIISNLYLPPSEAMPQAKAAAMKAVEIDDTLAEAHASLAVTLAFYEWDWVGAEREFKEALKLSPHYPRARLWYGRYLATRGRFDEAHSELKVGQQLDPLSAAINSEVGRIFFFRRQHDRAIAQLQETLQLEPDFWPAHLFLGWAYEQQGHYTEALAILHRASTLDDNPRTLASLGHAYAVAGNNAEAEKLLTSLQERSRSEYVSPYYLAGICVGLGRIDHAFFWFDRAFKDRSEWLVWLGVDPRFDRLHSDPRCKDLLRLVGLPTDARCSLPAAARS